MSLVLMATVLVAVNTPRLAHYTGVFAGTLVALFVLVEAPYSGMSINPARTVASAVPARDWTALWVYFVGPLLGMLLAAEAYRRLRGHYVHSAKLHDDHRRCLFHCDRHGGEPRDA